jgi:hypothetical protein
MYYTYILHETKTIHLQTEENWLEESDLIVNLAADIKKHNTHIEAMSYIEETKKRDYASSYTVNYGKL